MAAPAPLLAEAADSLALAVIDSSDTPVLMFDDALVVIAASRSFGEVFGIDVSTIAGRTLPQLGEGEWGAPQLAALLKATAAGCAEVKAYEMDLMRDGRMSRRLVVNARKLDYFDAELVRLVMSAADVTQARINEKLKDDLIREKEILLKELQHRVANSLQIIASVLMQSARRIRSDKARGQLRDARNRVMSLAAMQRQLSISSVAEVALRPYFTDLCDSIGASMILDDGKVSLAVDADESMAGADASVSLGLIVTELVINSLKHAFPHHRRGSILVKYRSSAPGWKLTVRDTGIGLASDPARTKPGLGTGIVAALARQLGASVTVADAAPGTSVTISRD